MFFYLPPEQWNPPYCIEGQEAWHITKALRMGAGTELRLLDGAGREGLFRIVGVCKERVELVVLSEMRHPVPVRRAILAVAWSKSARRGFFWEKAVELGAAEIWCWQAQRSQGRMPDDVRKNWQGQLIAGLKQCGNPYLPLVRVFVGGVRELAVHDPETFRILLREPGERCPMLSLGQLGRAGDTVYAIGPEGGFVPQEITVLIEAGYTPASLGDRPLRWETAALMCLSLHQFCSASGATVSGNSEVSYDCCKTFA
ncbi:MAG: 16S rRNA (uracil(1498)-N(3))-methyltransferase [Betaproteobacteria bacterium]|nr:16S rRNA (uracil(1498)-N(3))-methyltransferase [Betaproteobacteria bacterium]